MDYTKIDDSTIEQTKQVKVKQSFTRYEVETQIKVLTGQKDEYNRVADEKLAELYEIEKQMDNLKIEE